MKWISVEERLPKGIGSIVDAQINKDIEKKFDEKMSQVLALLGAPDESLEA